jgi:predicted ATPase
LENYFIVTGAMGSGKTTLIKEIKRSGVSVVDEPARQILVEQRAMGGTGVPEIDPQRFTDLMLSRLTSSYDKFREHNETVLFDRGIPDAIGYAKLFGLDLPPFKTASHSMPYNNSVFILPAWPEIYSTDDERKMSYEAAADFGADLRDIYETLGYRLIDVPKTPVKERVTFVLEHIRAIGPKAS